MMAAKFNRSSTVVTRSNKTGSTDAALHCVSDDSPAKYPVRPCKRSRSTQVEDGDVSGQLEQCAGNQAICMASNIDDFEACQKLMIEIRCGKLGAWDCLFDRALAKNCMLSRCLIAIGLADADISVISNDLAMAKRFALPTVDWLQLQSQDGNLLVARYSMYCLAEYYLLGIGVDRSDKRGVELLKSASVSVPCAQFKLGVCYQLGIGDVEDIVAAVRMYRLAAVSRHPCAESNLGMCYKKGLGVECCSDWAARYFQLAANQGLAAAQANLGECFMNGVGVGKSADNGISLYLQAVEKAFAPAQAKLAECYRDGNGVKANPKEALRLFKLAADQGDAGGQCGLGMMLQVGLHVLQDKAAALNLFQRSASQGNGTAQTQLAKYYLDGVAGVLTKDVLEAVRLFRLAVGRDIPEAVYRLGLCYKNGTGVVKDVYEAIRLFRLAAEKGNTDAKCVLANLEGLSW
jgi:TPR repeat protein